MKPTIHCEGTKALWSKSQIGRDLIYVRQSVYGKETDLSEVLTEVSLVE
jgi:hypothetical protein